MPQANESLKRERQLRGWSQSDLAKKIGVDDNAISRWERGKIIPSPYYRQKLCHLFGKEVQELGFPVELSPTPSDATETASLMALSELAEAVPELAESPSEPISASAAIQVAETSSPSQTFLMTKAVPLPHQFRLFHRGSLICALLLAMVVGAVTGLLVRPLLFPSLSLYQWATHTTPILADTLTRQDSTNQWDVHPSVCFFQSGAYQVKAPQQGIFTTCFERGQRLCDFAYQAEMTILYGDGGGLMFRETDAGQAERFRVSADGTYNLVGMLNDTLAGGTSPAIRVGFGQMNTLTVIMQGDTINLYINGQYISMTHDPNAHGCGLLGFLAVDFTNSAQVQFRHAKAWMLSEGS